MSKLGSVINSTARVGRPTNGPNWLQLGPDIEEAVADKVDKTNAKNHYNFKRDFETMREIKDFEKEHFSMSQITLYSTPLGMNTTNVIASPIDSITVRTKTSEHTPLTRPTELPYQTGKLHIPGDPDPDPSLSGSSSKKKNVIRRKMS